MFSLPIYTYKLSRVRSQKLNKYNNDNFIACKHWLLLCI